MTLRLILEASPHPQSRNDFRLADGQVVIGRGDDCDWKIKDPQMFISRRHCVIAGQGGQYRVTDESRGGRVSGPVDRAPRHRGYCPFAAGDADQARRFRDPGRNWKRQR